MASSGVNQCSSADACKAPTDLYQMGLKLFTLSLALLKIQKQKSKTKKKQTNNSPQKNQNGQKR